MKPLLLSILIIFSIQLGFGQENAGVDFTNVSYFEVLLLAEKENKPIFIEFGVNCGYCQKMKKEVFVDPEVGEFYSSNFINLVIDESSEVGKDLAERFNVYSYPTYFYLNPKGEIVHISANYKSPEKIIKEGQKALDEKTYSPSGVWWNKLKTRNKATYTLFNTANSSFMDLTGKSAEYSIENISLSGFESVSETQLSKAKKEIEESLNIEEYYFNTFTAAVIYYLSGELGKAYDYAQMALNDFPHHMKFMRTRDRVLNEIRVQIETIQKNH
ncbi:thioredoxin family protein [Flexithrix dorotheae]|uniref:thioredoxin family protein n=1 Tax=Flexithrix dorotheae TaxID=70993 RepID=UPI00037B464A|nr:thioredoxin family protein [Flexithrix dorotheae]